jgi:hypothetical protein
MSKRKSVGGAGAGKKAKLFEDEPSKPSFEDQKARAREWAKQNLDASKADTATDNAIRRATSPKKPRKAPAVLTPARGKLVDSPVATPASPVPAPVKNDTPVSPVATTTVKKPAAVRKSRAKAPVVEETPADLAVSKPVVTTASKVNTTKVKCATDSNMVPVVHHYFKAVGCCIKTLLPVFLAFVFVFYMSATLTGWTAENDYAKCAVIIGLMYSAVMVFYMFILLPLIIATRALDTMLFANGAAILTSSIFEISLLCLFVVGSLLVSSYNPVAAAQ